METKLGNMGLNNLNFFSIAGLLRAFNMLLYIVQLQGGLE